MKPDLNKEVINQFEKNNENVAYLPLNKYQKQKIRASENDPEELEWLNQFEQQLLELYGNIDFLYWSDKDKRAFKKKWPDNVLNCFL